MNKTIGEQIHTHSARVRRNGVLYEAHILGAQRSDGTWEGWIEFHTLDDTGAVKSTGQETSQPDRKALVYWAGGLEPIYLEGALTRALRQS
jgi:hypothetical protein